MPNPGFSVAQMVMARCPLVERITLGGIWVSGGHVSWRNWRPLVTAESEGQDPHRSALCATEAFQSALLAGSEGVGAVPELLPSRLAAACASALSVDGAGLSLISQGFRVPLGASTALSAVAERLQFTTGEGPCLHALREQTEIRASQDDTARRWPLFYDEFVRRTPYRSVASVPLRITPILRGAVDLYFVDPVGALGADLGDADTVALHMANMLRQDPSPLVPSLEIPDTVVPAWSYSPAARQRFRTWIAAGVIMAHYEMAAAEALDRLRAYTFSQEQDIDQVTEALIDGTLRPEMLAGE